MCIRDRPGAGENCAAASARSEAARTAGGLNVHNGSLVVSATGSGSRRSHCLQQPLLPTLVVAPPPPCPPSGRPTTARPRVSRAAVRALMVRFMICLLRGCPTIAVTTTMTAYDDPRLGRTSETSTQVSPTFYPYVTIPSRFQAILRPQISPLSCLLY